MNESVGVASLIEAAKVLNPDTETAEGVEISGAMKWFDAGMGYGFILPDSGGEDVLVHVNCLRRDGFQTAAEGARVTCIAKKGERGWQAFSVLSLDMTTAVKPKEPLNTLERAAIVPKGGFERALVKWFNRTKGFGFLTRGEGTDDIFVHMEILRRFNITELRPGQVMIVRSGPTDKGLSATEIYPDIGSIPGLQV